MPRHDRWLGRSRVRPEDEDFFPHRIDFALAPIQYPSPPSALNFGNVSVPRIRSVVSYASGVLGCRPAPRPSPLRLQPNLTRANFTNVAALDSFSRTVSGISSRRMSLSIRKCRASKLTGQSKWGGRRLCGVG